MSRTYWIYILASRSRNLYVGVTNDLQRRMIEHRQGLVPGFTSRYKIFRLVHCEQFADIRDAISREKEIKGWRREKKNKLVRAFNPKWKDLGWELFGPRSGEVTSRRLLRLAPSRIRAVTIAVARSLAVCATRDDTGIQPPTVQRPAKR